jgi:hypothetical protein
MASGSYAPPPPPPPEEYYDEELDFLFTSDGENFNSSDDSNEEALEDGNFFRPGKEEKWMWRTTRFSVRNKAEHCHKRDEEVAADQEELQRALTASREATPVIVLSDDE